MTYIATYIMLFVSWTLWSGKFDAFHLALGAISCALVTFISNDLLFNHNKFSTRQVMETLRFIKYIPWLLYQILLSNIHVAYLVLSPSRQS
jgi:multicomponent Na+:H+ antiporter subunit E